MGAVEAKRHQDCGCREAGRSRETHDRPGRLLQLL